MIKLFFFTTNLIENDRNIINFILMSSHECVDLYGCGRVEKNSKVENENENVRYFE